MLKEYVVLLKGPRAVRISKVKAHTSEHEIQKGKTTDENEIVMIEATTGRIKGPKRCERASKKMRRFTTRYKIITTALQNKLLT